MSTAATAGDYHSGTAVVAVVDSKAHNVRRASGISIGTSGLSMHTAAAAAAVPAAPQSAAGLRISPPTTASPLHIRRGELLRRHSYSLQLSGPNAVVAGAGASYSSSGGERSASFTNMHPRGPETSSPTEPMASPERRTAALWAQQQGQQPHSPLPPSALQQQLPTHGTPPSHSSAAFALGNSSAARARRGQYYGAPGSPHVVESWAPPSPQQPPSAAFPSPLQLPSPSQQHHQYPPPHSSPPSVRGVQTPTAAAQRFLSQFKLLAQLQQARLAGGGGGEAIGSFAHSTGHIPTAATSSSNIKPSAVRRVISAAPSWGGSVHHIKQPTTPSSPYSSAAAAVSSGGGGFNPSLSPSSQLHRPPRSTSSHAHAAAAAAGLLPARHVAQPSLGGFEIRFRGVNQAPSSVLASAHQQLAGALPTSGSATAGGGSTAAASPAGSGPSSARPSIIAKREGTPSGKARLGFFTRNKRDSEP